MANIEEQSSPARSARSAATPRPRRPHFDPASLSAGSDDNTWLEQATNSIRLRGDDAQDGFGRAA
jgi:hypothetical protein